MTQSDPDKSEVWLSVSFDAKQLGRQLCWTATEDRANLFHIYGRFAGSLALPKDRGLRVEVHGYGDEFLHSFKILSVCLVTAPADDKLPPSPFVGNDTATVLIDDFPPADVIIDDPHIGRRYGISASQKPLLIGNQDGAWQISMILTVQIVDSADGEPYLRVFRFDPESQVGNGTR